MEYFIKTEKLWHQFTGRIAIIKIRKIQRQYKKLSVENAYNRTNQILTKLQLLLAKEEYYKSQFQAWGKYCVQFSFNEEDCKKQIKFLNWLFPPKDFDEIDLVLNYSSEANLMFRNKLFRHGHSNDVMMNEVAQKRKQVEFKRPVYNNKKKRRNKRY